MRCCSQIQAYSKPHGSRLRFIARSAVPQTACEVVRWTTVCSFTGTSSLLLNPSVTHSARCSSDSSAGEMRAVLLLFGGLGHLLFLNLGCRHDVSLVCRPCHGMPCTGGNKAPPLVITAPIFLETVHLEIVRWNSLSQF